MKGWLKLAGALLLLSDLKDVPKTDRVHHWQIGLLLLLLK